MPGDALSLLPANTGACRKKEMTFIMDEDMRKRRRAGRLCGLADKACQLALTANVDVMLLVIDRTGSAPSALFSTNDRGFGLVDEFKQRFGNSLVPLPDTLNKKHLTTKLIGCQESAVLISKNCFPLGAELSLAEALASNAVASTIRTGHGPNLTADSSLFEPMSGLQSSMDIASDFDFALGGQSSAIQPITPLQPLLWRSSNAHGGMAVLPPMVLV